MKVENWRGETGGEGHRAEEMAARERRSLSILSVKKEAKLSSGEVDDVKEGKGDAHLRRSSYSLPETARIFRGRDKIREIVLNRSSSQVWEEHCVQTLCSCSIVTKTVVFGWEYRCVDRFRWTSRADSRKRKGRRRPVCAGVMQTTRNTWFEKGHSTSTCLALLFCWVNRLPVIAVVEATVVDPVLHVWKQQQASWKSLSPGHLGERCESGAWALCIHILSLTHQRPSSMLLSPAKWN